MGLIRSELELVWNASANIGESPAWDHRSGHLIWVDIDGRTLNLYHPLTKTNRQIQMALKVSAAVPSLQGNLMMATENGFYKFDLVTERMSYLVDPELDKPGNRFNDGKCDHSGRFWAGTMSREGSLPTGSLYCLETSGTCRKVISPVSVSNGLEWSLDHKTMYYIDSPTLKVMAYDYAEDTGQMSNPRTIVTIPQGEGLPDGMTIDNEGMLWIAQWGGWQVSRWDPATGVKLASITLPVEQVSSCAFGGEDYDELYITTASNKLSMEKLQQQPLAGGLFRVKLGVKGRPTHFYGHDSQPFPENWHITDKGYN